MTISYLVPLLCHLRWLVFLSTVGCLYWFGVLVRFDITTSIFLCRENIARHSRIEQKTNIRWTLISLSEIMATGRAGGTAKFKS